MEEITIEKIDIIRNRFGVSYEEARDALTANNGNLVETLIYLEKNEKSFSKNVSEAGNELIETIKGIIKKGNVNRIKVKKGERVLVDIPVNAGVVTGALAIYYPALLAIGTAAAILSQVRIEIERPDGKVDVINDIVKNKYNDVKNNFNTNTGDVKEKAKEAYEDVKDKAKEYYNDVKEKAEEHQDEKNSNNNFNGNI